MENGGDPSGYIGMYRKLSGCVGICGSGALVL